MANEKKVEIVTKSGKIIRVMPHMLNDLAKFDATPKRPVVKPTPKELLGIPPGAKPSILPRMAVSKPAPDLAVEEPVKTRKPPVRSKSTKK